jgi:hypothetical protein
MAPVLFLVFKFFEDPTRFLNVAIIGATNGAVFHTSAAMIPTIDHAGSRSQLMSAPSTAFTKPGLWSNMYRHTWAATAVGITHGTRMTARVSPRPTKAWCMISANAMPITNSRDTEATVKISVFLAAFQKLGSVSART